MVKVRKSDHMLPEELFLCNFVKSCFMKTNIIKQTVKKKQINWALPNQSCSHDEFKAAIKEAEAGPFITVDEFEQRFEEWKRKKDL
jgi:predicted transcriptional regulator